MRNTRVIFHSISNYRHQAFIRKVLVQKLKVTFLMKLQKLQCISHFPDKVAEISYFPDEVAEITSYFPDEVAEITMYKLLS